MKRTIPARRRDAASLAMVLALALTTGGTAQEPPTFSKRFEPPTIGPGSVSTLVFEIVNQDLVNPLSNLAFTDTLPAGVTIADPASAVTDCAGGVVNAPDGGSTITFVNGQVGPASSCTVEVNVTSATPGLHNNVSGELTSGAGSLGTATADLTVDPNRPGFTKSFVPASILLGETSTLTLTIDNTLSEGAASDLAFTDTLPPGVVIASPSNASTTCPGALLTATAGTQQVDFLLGSVGGLSSCTVTVDVDGAAADTHVNTTSDLSSNQGSSGKATAAIDVASAELLLTKEFVDDPVPPGGLVELEFTVRNLNRNDGATGVAFTDDLGAVLAGLEATGLPAGGVCGAGSTLAGTSLLTLSGGSLEAAQSCTFSVLLQVPAMASPGSFLNTTSTVTADVGGVMVTGPAATDDLVVEVAPLLTKEFIDDPAPAGGTVTLRFTITNPDPEASASGIAFDDDLSTMLPGTTVSSLPAAGFCGPGATATAAASVLTISGASLGPADSCTFDVVLDLPGIVPAGSFTNTTSPITATVEDFTVIGDPATAELAVLGAPVLEKAFVDDPVLPGATVTLEFTLSLTPDAPAGVTAINFTDDLGAVVAGLAATGLPATDVCGTGSQIAGTSTLSLTGGSLAPGESCTFSVSLDVPADAPAGAHTNTTSDVVATAAGELVTEIPAIDDLQVAALVVSKAFVDDPAVPGGTVTLEFQIENLSPVLDATVIAFTDDLDAVVPGLVATGLPAADVCGTGSQITGTDTLSLTGGNLAPGASCTVSVTLQVPSGVSPGEFDNITSLITAQVDGLAVTLPPVSDALTLVEPLSLAKSFVDDPATPGGVVTLEFTVANADLTETAADLAFTDDLGAVIPGLVATGLPAADVCGPGSQLTGTSVVSLTGGTLPPGGSCTFSVPVQVPGDVASGTEATNTTSPLDGTVGGVVTSAPPASDTLQVDLFTFSKAFDGSVVAGGTVELTFTIQNLDSDTTAEGISFVDDLDAFIPGAEAVGLPVSGVCGPISTLSGSGVVTLAGGSLPPGGSCTFTVSVRVPADTAAGAYTNTTGDLLLSGVPSGAPASAPLDVRANLLVIPTLGFWGLVVLIGALALAAVLRLRSPSVP